MRTVLVMTKKERKQIEKATKAMAQAGVSIQDFCAACRAVSKAMISFKDCIPILKKNRNTVFLDKK